MRPARGSRASTREHGDCALTEPRNFNLMFKTFMGPVEESASVVYLRPETAQGIYVNFLNVQQASRQKIPFGIAQIGKAFRNEITPGNFIFRTREFEQMEMQFFVDPASDHMQWFEYWKAQRMQWHRSLGLQEDRLLFHAHTPEELAHYARAAFDIQFDFGGTLGFQEIEGVHHRGDFDLSRHQEYSTSGWSTRTRSTTGDISRSSSRRRLVPIAPRSRSWSTPIGRKPSPVRRKGAWSSGCSRRWRRSRPGYSP
jgi:glycyl-tRNA synthetase (class II)